MPNLRAIFDQAAVGVAQVAPDGRFLEVNHKLCKMVGWSREELMQRTFQEITHPEDLGKDLDLAEQVLRGEISTYTMEKRYLRKDGAWTWVDLSVSSVSSVSAVGERDRIFLAIIVDIDARKRAEAHAESQRALLEALLEACPAGVIMADAGGKLVRMNKANERLWGVAPMSESVEEYRVWKGWWADGSERHGRLLEPQEWALARALRGEVAPGDVVEIEAFDEARTHRVMINSGAPVRDRAGRVIGGVIAQMDITELVRMEGELRLSEKRYRQLFEANPQPMWVFDVETLAFLAVNNAAIAHYGWSKEEFLQMTIADIRPPEDVPRLREVVGVVKEGIDHAGVWCHRRKDGTLMDVEITAHAVNFSGRQAELVLALDVTERRAAQRALRDNEARLRLALDAAHMGTYDWDIVKNRITWSRVHEELWGYAPGEFDGSYAAFRARLHPDDLPEIEAQVAHSRETRQPYHSEYRVVWPDGSVHWIVGRGEFAFDAAGRPVRMLGAVMEVTARKLAEDALRESEHRLQLFVEHSPAAIAMFDRGMRYLAVSRRWLVDFRLEGTPVIGRSHYEVFPDLPARWREVHRRCLAGAVEKCEEEAFERADGSTEWVRWEIHPWRDASGEIGGLMLFSEVITQRKRTEATLRLLSRRLLQAEDEERRRIAKELHDSTAQDLVAAMMNLNLLCATEPALPQASLIEDSIAILENAASDVRTLSYLLHPPRLDEAGLAGALTQYAAGLSRRTDVRVRVDAEMAPGRFAEEVERAVFRVAQECLGNIVRHAEADAADLRLQVRGDRLVLEVQDFGRGMPTEAMEAGAGGVGIVGMRERLEQLGGALEIETGPNGTTVRAVLPCEL